MTESMEHSRAFELLELYIFGNLDRDEYDAVQAHLDTGCEECLKRIRELSELSVLLARAVPQKDTPEHIKQGILENTRKEESRSSSNPHKKTARLNWYITGIAAVLIIGLGIGLVLMQMRNSELEDSLAEARDVTNLLESPGMQFVNLEGVDPNPQAFGKVVLDPDKGNAVVYMYRLPQNPEGMEYQLWVMREGKPTSAGVFSVSEGGEAVLALNDLPELDSIPTFLVTIEPEGGKNAPTGMMYLTGPEENGKSKN
ncbi:MAG: hypothetical protein GF315_06335 [candidate division Zixibacteria bacterium]|nr:hypothetical protein [candidate division Zixibacteria bacterium]